MNYIFKMKAKHAYNVRKKAELQECLANMYEERLEEKMLEEKIYGKKERIHILTPRAKEKIEETVNNSMTFLYAAWTYGIINYFEAAMGFFTVYALNKKQYGWSLVYVMLGGGMKVVEKLFADELVLPHKGD